MLHLPDVAELVADEILVVWWVPEEDRARHRVAVVEPKPRQSEEPRRDDDPNSTRAYRARVNREPIQARAGAREDFH